MKWGSRCLAPLLALGIASIVYWHVTEARGAGDLRFYGLVQFYPMAAIPLMVALFPPRYSRTADLLVLLGCYVFAKTFELLDASLFEFLGHTVSGHTLKHLAAAAGIGWLLRMLRKRRPLALAR